MYHKGKLYFSLLSWGESVYRIKLKEAVSICSTNGGKISFRSALTFSFIFQNRFRLPIRSWNDFEAVGTNFTDISYL
ncbi:hypothetical protein LEP1GSC047_0358 [Leptospira inadai serovar Lyme str. 10]|uniref:Uncharacterized protein n=2 Tax=Leptospira inadai serovar Lyme TaxID=293084 RepID=V6H9D5_9LEPT|nr:hypothetical protein LEP1GSC047_0358 [Leptospira inadai serovar Lyme str. 10]PNV76852.1 hypothetical protein BES34_000780 [Leptospira inadai serovar Lyme]